MRNKKASIRGVLMRDLMKNMMESAMGHPFQTGEFRMYPMEPAWICPDGYEYEIIEREDFKMEYLRPAEVSTGRGDPSAPRRRLYRTDEEYVP